MINNIVENKLIRKMLAVMLVMSLTMTNFIFVAVESFAAYDENINIIKDNTSEQKNGDVNKSEGPISRLNVLSNKTVISALENVNNVRLTISMLTENENDYLYKNPTFIVEMPENVKISKFVGMEMVADTEFNKYEYEVENNKIIIKVEGEQKEHSNDDSLLNAQINLDMELEVSKNIPSIVSNFKVNYKNENDVDQSGNMVERTIKSSDINVYTGYGLVSNLRVENFDGKGGIVNSDVTTNGNSEAKIEMNDSSKLVLISGNVINNYSENDVTIKEAKVEVKLKNYSGYESKIEIQNYKDISNSNSIMTSGSKKEFTAQFMLPENLYYNEEVSVIYTVIYMFNKVEYKQIARVDLKTESKDFVGDVFVSDDRTVRVEVAKVLGNNTLISNNSKVYEGATIKYVITVTNLTENVLTDATIKMTRENDNSKFYAYKYYEKGIFEEDLYTKEEIDSLTGNVKISKIDAKGDKSVQYELVVLNDSESKNLVNKLELKINDKNVVFNEKDFIETTSNKIEDAPIKLNLKYAVPQELIVNNPTLQAGMTDVLLVDIQNISSNELDDVQIKIDASKYPTIKNMYLEDYSTLNYSFENGIFTFIVNKIKPGERLTEHIKIYFDEMEEKEQEIRLNLSSVINEKEYLSNCLAFKLVNKDVKSDINITTNFDNESKVKNNDVIEYTVNVKNTGYNDFVVNVYDKIASTFIFEKLQINEKDVSSDDIVNCYVDVKVGEEANIKLILNVNTDVNDLENEIMVTIGDNQKIYTYKYELEENTENIENPIEPSGKLDDNGEEVITDEPGDIADKPGNITDDPGDITDNPGKDDERKYSIKGKAWLDENKDGIFNSDEKLMKDIKVLLVDAKNQNTIIKETVTDENGKYSFDDLNDGNYFVVFDYDTKVYEIATYKVNDVEEANNSNVKDYAKADKTLYAISDTINLNENIENLNIGLKLLPKFDLKLENYITKVVIQNLNGTETTEFTDTKLAKVEIPSKVLSGSTVLVEYNIKISNIGELAGNAQEIIDYIPNGMSFNSELNSEWYMASDGNVYNTSLANTIINPGEEKEIKLVLTKQMTSSNVGTNSNTVKIEKYANSKEFKDINEENNKDKTEVIVSIKTGDVVTYIALAMASIIVIAGGVYFIKKKIL